MTTPAQDRPIQDDDIRAALTAEAGDVMTVDQLRSRVHAALAEHPTAEHRTAEHPTAEYPHAGGTHPRFRRALVPLAAAAAVLVVATPTAVRVLHHQSYTAVAPSRTAPVLPASVGRVPTLSMTVRLPATLRQSGTMVFPTMQVILIDPAAGLADNDYSGTAVTTYQPGAFQQSKFLATATATSVAGHDAHFGKYPDLAGRHVYLLAWPISGQRWISVEVSPEDTNGVALSGARSLAAARVIAAMVDATAVPYSITTALSVAHVPAGLRITAVSDSYPAGEQTWGCYFVFERPGHADSQLTVAAQPVSTGPNSVSVRPNINAVNGHRAQFLTKAPGSPHTAQLQLQFGRNVVTLGGAFSKAQFLAIAAGITLLPNPGDVKTWRSATS